MDRLVTAPRGDMIRKVSPAGSAAFVFLCMAALKLFGDHATYIQALLSWGLKPSFRFTFLDTDTVLSALRCLRAGTDVFVTNPCDPLGRVYDYSPLWLVLAVFPVTPAWTAPIGLAVDSAFFCSLLLLPAGRGIGATAMIVAGALSTETAFAVERGNNDLVIFTLAALAASLASRSAKLRLAGYGCAFLAGLLKYYPMTLMVLASRETPRRFCMVTLASVAGLAAFVAIAGHDLTRALALIPTGSYFGDMFGARTLPGGLLQLVRLPDQLATYAELTLVAASMAIGIRAGFGAAIGADVGLLTEAERSFLLAGALLILGCFLTAQNIGYRTVHLLFVLPGLTTLWRVGQRRWLYGATALVAVFLMWSDGWRHWLEVVPSANAPLLGWLAREAAWWLTITVLAALATAMVARSTMGRVVFR